MIGKVCRNNQYQLKNKSNHVTNTSRVKCEIKRICDSHNILPSLITDCPHCKEILNTLQKRGNERGVIPDKLKPFIHNYTKLFCNQQILHRVIDKDSLTQKRAKVDKNKEKIDQNSSHDRHLKSSKMKQRFENMKESFWNFVDSDICKKRDKRESIETAQEKRERRHLKHEIRSETQSDNLTTNSQDSVTEEESTSASPKISSTKSRYCLLSKQSSIKHVERLWSKSLERKNQLKKDLSPNKSVRFSIVIRPNKRDHYVADKPQLVILSSATDAATNTSNGTSSILSDKEDNVQQRKNKQSSEKIKPDLEHFNLLGNVNNNCDESPKNKNNRDNDLEEKTEKLKYRNATYGTNSKSLVSLKNSLKPGKLTQNSMESETHYQRNEQPSIDASNHCNSNQQENNKIMNCNHPFQQSNNAPYHSTTPSKWHRGHHPHTNTKKIITLPEKQKITDSNNPKSIFKFKTMYSTMTQNEPNISFVQYKPNYKFQTNTNSHLYGDKRYSRKEESIYSNREVYPYKEKYPIKEFYSTQEPCLSYERYCSLPQHKTNYFNKETYSYKDTGNENYLINENYAQSPTIPTMNHKLMVNNFNDPMSMQENPKQSLFWTKKYEQSGFRKQLDVKSIYGLQSKFQNIRNVLSPKKRFGTVINSIDGETCFKLPKVDKYDYLKTQINSTPEIGKRPHPLVRNLPVAENHIHLRSEASSLKLKNKNYKFKSEVKPYNIASRRKSKVTNSVKFKRLKDVRQKNQTELNQTDINSLLKKYLGNEYNTERMQSKEMNNTYGIGISRMESVEINRKCSDFDFKFPSLKPQINFHLENGYEKRCGNKKYNNSLSSERNNMETNKCEKKIEDNSSRCSPESRGKNVTLKESDFNDKCRRLKSLLIKQKIGDHRAQTNTETEEKNFKTLVPKSEQSKATEQSPKHVKFDGPKSNNRSRTPKSKCTNKNKSSKNEEKTQVKLKSEYKIISYR
ncbi:hypothetical protein M8J77_009302 [Diaphorina citri]|nr:hypothetical protein M8J77_009302 [Diaphorina citri]